MEVFVLFPAYPDGYAFLASTGFPDAVRHALIDGERVGPELHDELSIGRPSDTFPDLLGTGSSEFLVSDRFKAVLERHGRRDELNFVPIEVEGRPYHLLNLLGLRDAMDREQSVYTAFDDGFPDTIEWLEVVPDRVDEYDIFRLETKPELVFVSAALRTALEAEGVTGLRFFGGRNLEVLQ